MTSPLAIAGNDSSQPVRKGRPIVVSLMLRDVKKLGGQETRWGRIACDLDTPELDLSIICTRSFIKAWERAGLGSPSVRTAVFDDRGPKLAVWILAQLFALRQIPRGAVVHLPGPGLLVLPAAILCRFLKRCKIVTSLTVSRVLPLRLTRASRKTYRVLRTALYFSDLVDALNPKIDVDAFVSNDKLSIAPCSFSDPAKYRAHRTKRQKVVFGGNFGWQKGCDLLIEIVKLWPTTGDCLLVICGSGPYESRLREAAKHRHDIQIGQTWALANELADAKVFLSLQQWDNYPSQSLIEAMLCECCVVATDTGDTHLLVAEPWGRRLDVNAPASEYMSAIMHFLCKPEDERCTAGRSARHFILETHTQATYMRYLESLWTRASMLPPRTS